MFLLAISVAIQSQSQLTMDVNLALIDCAWQIERNRMFAVAITAWRRTQREKKRRKWYDLPVENI